MSYLVVVVAGHLLPGFLFILISGVYMWAIFSRHFKTMYDQTYEFKGLLGRVVVPWGKRCWSLSTIMLILLIPDITLCTYRTQRRKTVKHADKMIFRSMCAYTVHVTYRSILTFDCSWTRGWGFNPGVTLSFFFLSFLYWARTRDSTFHQAI